MAIQDGSRCQAYAANVGRKLRKSISADAFELPALADTKSAVQPSRLGASAYCFGSSGRGMGYPSMSRRSLPRSGSSWSIVSPAGSSGSGSSSVSDPFRDLLKDLEANTRERGTEICNTSPADLDLTPSRECKHELRRRANQARLDACDDLKRHVSDIKAAARHSQRKAMLAQPRPLKKELRLLKESICRSQDSLLENNAAELLAQKDIEFSPAFKAKLKRVKSKKEGLHPVCADLFGTSPGKYFLSRLHRYQENLS